MPSLFRALHERPFALLWSGQTVSLLGDRVFQVALAWWVLEKTGSAAAMGTVMVFSILPMLIFLLVGGVFVDRFPRLWLMVISDVVRGLVIGLLAIFAFAGWLTIWHVYLLSLVSGFVEAFFRPAYSAAVPEITPQEHLTSANSLTSLSNQIGGIMGPAVGALIVALGGTPLALALDALSFFVSALCLMPLLTFATQSHNKAQGMVHEARQGITTVMASPWLWVTIGIAGLSNIAYGGPMEVVLPFLIKEYHQADVSVLGLFYSAASLGSLLAAIWIGRLPRLRRRGLILYGVWMVIGIMVIFIGLPIPIPAILVAALIIGACNTTLGLVWVNTLQEMVPPDLMGRVTSIDCLGSYLLLPLGYAIGGWAAELVGVSMVFVIGGVLETTLIALGLLHPQVRTLD
jgi:DHA3 family tetracycline resistance protein-like MFS transporter